MPEYEDDLRTFIRWQTAEVDRARRESWKIIQEALHRNDALIERCIAEFDDSRDERRAVVDALFKLIDKIDELGRRINPGDGPAPA